MKIATESWILAAIGAADLITTIIFIQNYGAEEANPLFQSYWSAGLLAFILAKTACVVCPLFLLEWARRRKPRFVSWALRAAIVCYLGIYGVGFLKLNSVQAQDRDMVGIAARF